MKTKLYPVFISLLCVWVIFQTDTQGAQPLISSFGQNGELVCTNLEPGSLYTVEWASSANGPWMSSWAGLDTAVAGSNGMIRISVPMFYRIRGVTPIQSMVLIPAGSFTMGDTLDGLSDATPTNVTVSAFYIAANLVTYADWVTVYNWAINHGYGFHYAGTGKAVSHPVYTIDWYDAVKWCNARSEMEGLTPAYYTDAWQTNVYRIGWTNVQNEWVKWNKGYRLPTEAEWEKAARGGLSGQRFPWGNTISESQANYYGNTNSYGYDLGPNGYNPLAAHGALPDTSPVESFAENGYGLYDMAGNVNEWCWDCYDYSYKYAGGTDPHGPVFSLNAQRVLRGGSWSDTAGSASAARCAYRSKNDPQNGAIGYFGDTGFRCARGFP